MVLRERDMILHFVITFEKQIIITRPALSKEKKRMSMTDRQTDTQGSHTQMMG